MANRIDCINKTDRYNPHERIQNVGGVNDSGRWKITQQECINYIETQNYEFYVEVDGDRVEVIVAERNGVKYIKTENDGDQPNNLLSLPECP